MYKYNGPVREDGVNLGTSYIQYQSEEGINTDWDAFLRWEAGGNTPAPWKTQAEMDAELAYLIRISEVEDEKAQADVHTKTPQEVKDWIDAEFAGASTNAELVVVIKKILKKMAVYILK